VLLYKNKKAKNLRQKDEKEYKIKGISPKRAKSGFAPFYI
jgi:hypothetical protein